MASRPEIETFGDFWLFYLGEHRSRLNRNLHALGSLSALTWIGLAIAWGSPWLGLAALVNGYGLAWIGHFFVEKNRPASFKYPGWSFLADWVMLAYVLSGRINRELERLPAAPAAEGGAPVAPPCT